MRKEEGKSSFLGRSTTKISFSTEHRAALLTALLSQRAAATEGEGKKAASSPAFAGTLLTESGVPMPVALLACPFALELRAMASAAPGAEADAAAAAATRSALVGELAYESIAAIRAVREGEGGAGGASTTLFAVHHGHGRVALLSCDKRRELHAALTK